MKAIVVRYRAKPERADENQKLIEAVFAELEQQSPRGFTYKVFRLEDRVSFVHVVIEHDVETRFAGRRTGVPGLRGGYRRPMRRTSRCDGCDRRRRLQLIGGPSGHRSGFRAPNRW